MQECIEPGPLSQLPTNAQDSTDVATSPTSVKANAGVLSPAATSAASRCLYLQGVRALIKYVPQYFKKEHIEVAIDKLLQCSKCASLYEHVHTAERALENMAENLDPQQCMEALSKHLCTSKTPTRTDTSMADENAAAALLTLRALSKVIGRIPKEDVRKSLPSLKPVIFASLSNSQVDMRKATVFLIVEMHESLGDDVLNELESISPAQQKLISIYINRRKQENAKKGSSTGTSQ